MKGNHLAPIFHCRWALPTASLLVVAASLIASAPAGETAAFDLVGIEQPRILEKAAKYLREEPVTVSASHCNRSAGGKHDFFSEGDYWWPDPKNPDGPYIQRDGMSNPDNFVEHRHAMIRLSEIVATMGSAYVL